MEGINGTLYNLRIILCPEYKLNIYNINIQKVNYYKEFLEYFETNYKQSSTIAIIETVMLIESKYYRQISKVITRFLGNILDLSKLNDTEYYLTENKYINYI